MAKREITAEPVRITGIDIKIAVAILICCLTSVLLNHFGIRFQYGQMSLEIIQKMTACISCLLVCQKDMVSSTGAGKNRLVITAIGGLVGMIVVCIDTGINSEWFFAILVALGALLTLLLCKVCKVPYINARIGGVTFILVSCTFSEYARIYYALFRLISTFYGVLVAVVICWVWEKLFENGTYQDKE